MSRHRVNIVPVAISCFLGLLTVSAVADAQAPLDKWDVQLRVTSTRREGPTGRSAAAAGESMAVGDSFKKMLFSGGGGSSQGFASTVPKDDLVRGKYEYVWAAEARVAAATLNSVTVQLDWIRYAVRDGNLVREAGDQRTVLLNDGERHIVDFVATPPNSAYANVLVELSAKPAPLAGQEFVPVEYDVWLFYERPDGTKTNRRVTTLGLSDWATPFAFEPFSMPLEVVSAAQKGDLLALSALFKGTLAMRLRSDGSLVVTVDVSESLRVGGLSLFGKSSSRSFVCAFGETTRIDFDLDVSGHGVQPLPPGTRIPTHLVDGASVENGNRLRLTLPDYFRNDKVWLLVTARPR